MKTRYALCAQLQGTPNDTHVLLEKACNLVELREHVKHFLAHNEVTQIWRLQGITKNLMQRVPETRTPENCISIAWWEEQNRVNWLYVCAWSDESKWYFPSYHDVNQETTVWQERTRTV